MASPHRVLAVLTLVAGAVSAHAATAQTHGANGADRPPAVDPPPGVDTLHGVEMVDPYRWLEDLDDPDVQAWARVRDGIARSYAARNPRRSELRRQIERIGTRPVISAPYRRAERLLYSRFQLTGPDRTIEVLAMDADGTERIVVDPVAFRAATGETPLRFFPSPDGRFVAVASARSGEVWERLRVVDVGTGDFAGRAAARAAAEIEGVHATLSVVAWAPGAQGFYYQAYTPRADGTVGAPVVRFHRLGSDQDEDLVVYDPGREDVFLGMSSSPGAPYLVLTERIGSETGRRLLVHPIEDPAGETRDLEAPPATYVYAGAIGDRLWFRSDHEAPNGNVVAFRATRPEDGYRVVVPEAADPISTWTGVAPVGAAVVGERLLVTYLSEGRAIPKLFSLEGEAKGQLELPYAGSLWSGWVGREHDTTVFYSLSGLADPATVYALDLDSGESELFRAPDMPYDLDDIRTDFVRVPARDGARIPAFVVRRTDTELDGTAPLVLYGYGYSGWDAAPYFYPLMASLVERGAIWVVAAVRGDGGYGTPWHLAGRRRNKPTAIADYVDVSRWLVANDYTAADRLVANGSSAGGALVAAAVTSHPDLYGAMILDYPFVDVLRYELFGTASGAVPEYGTVSDVGDFRVMRSYAPLQNLEPAACYPATFLAPGENDGRTPPLHAYKLAAALEDASACDAPVLLRISWGAGHTAGADLTRSLDNWADQAAFLDAVLPEGSLR